MVGFLGGWVWVWIWFWLWPEIIVFDLAISLMRVARTRVSFSPSEAISTQVLVGRWVKPQSWRARRVWIGKA